MNNVGLHHYVAINKLRRKAVISPYPTYLGGSKKDIIRSLLLKKGLDLCLSFQIQLYVGAPDDIRVSLFLESQADG